MSWSIRVLTVVRGHVTAAQTATSVELDKLAIVVDVRSAAADAQA